MKPPVISTLAFLLFALILPVFAQNGGGAPQFSRAPYQIGERLTYNVSYSAFPSAAHAEFHIVSRGTHFERDAVELRAHVQTMDVVNVALLAINNDYTSYIDPLTGLPFRSEETVRDAIKTDEAARELNQAAGSEAIPPKQRGFPGTYDLLSAFYRARALPLGSGGTFSFSVRGAGGEYNVELRVTGRESVNTNVGSFSTIVTKVRVSNSPLRNVRVYFSEDERHVPVLITAEIGDGDLRAELAASEIIVPKPIATPTPQTSVRPGPIPLATPAPTVAPPVDDDSLPFKVGEQLNYQIFIGPSPTPMGIATFQVKGRQRYFDREGLFLSVNAHTTNALAQVFVARDQIDSYVDPKALLPFRTVMNLIEGRRRLNQTLLMGQDNGVASTAEGLRIEMPVGTHDYLSFFYAVRTFNLTPARKSVTSMLVENKPKTLFVTAQKREAIQLGSQSVPAIALTITTDDPEPDKYQLRMWISDDRRRLPLRISCATQLGPLRADLAILPAASN
ncbi:MAG TPA: DUF3108 domain-containing protein [Pyrinomonadaceae bacterium]|nr:DUF3108 domain-containing protein [Pyrinomonadaceae bacterium]